MSEETRGRKTINNKAVLEAILKNAETRKAFKEKIDNLVFHKKQQLLEAEAYKEDVGATSDSTGLSKGWINSFVTALAKGTELDLLAKTVDSGFDEVLSEVYHLELETES